MKTRLNWIFGCCLGAGLLFAQAVHAQLTFTNENAGVQATTVPGVATNAGLLLMVVVSALFGVDHRHQVLCKCKSRAN